MNLVAVPKASVDEIFNHSIHLTVEKPKKETTEKKDKSKESEKSSSRKK